MIDSKHQRKIISIAGGTWGFSLPSSQGLYFNTTLTITITEV